MRSLLFFFLLTASSAAFSQNLKYCGADELRISNLKQIPKIAKAAIEREAKLESFTQNYIIQNQHKNIHADSALYLIPVVYHVIHNYGTENISDAQLHDGLRVLNNTFRKQTPDTAEIIPAFKPLHADCQIEFRLASKDPQGNCHSGINRIASHLTQSGGHEVKSLIHWDPSKYLNIYVVDNAAGLAGHCVWPSDADTIPTWDGIVISNNYLGSIGTSSPLSSVVLAHECGHYLNLHHIWGGNNVPNFYYYPCADPNKDCSIDDLVDDTPPTIGWQSCNLAGSSCGNVVDMVQNAMDYSYCNKMFTYGQKDRMIACLNSSIAHRNNLWQPQNLIETGVANSPTLCKADFVADKYAVCPNTTNQITFTNTSYFAIADSVQWIFPSGNPAVSNNASPTVTYTAPGKHDVTLKVFSGGNSEEITKPNCITVLSETNQPFPFTESFETTTSLSGPDWFENSLDTFNRWEVSTLAAVNGSQSVMLNNADFVQSGKDELYSPPINLYEVDAASLKFKYAFAGKDSIINDKLQVYITKNCTNNWSLRLSLGGLSLQTAPPQEAPFVPQTDSLWKTGTVNVPSTYLASGFRFKFVYTGGGGNNLYLDDINLDLPSGIPMNGYFNLQLQLAPNPAFNQITSQFYLPKNTEVQFSVITILGEVVYRSSIQNYAAGKSNFQLNLETTSNGFYTFCISTPFGQARRPFLVNKE